jgi:GT2 family glycosyltransferase/glycosyltransferase involved in cell wall biosynthesis
VSIIIPICGKIDITLDCLRSISSNPQNTEFEIIIIDDSSPDSSIKWLSMIPGIRIKSNSENKGFIYSCNEGAAAGAGVFLHFLNNDTLVTSNWLDELVDTFSSHSNVGMVGSKLLYPDGKLQEAGGIIWRDGSAWNYGRFDNPDKPEYSYARQVDYCSGASILIKKQLFFSFDGFDQHFMPAYCEDSDLALKVTQAGLRVMYQPASTVYHLEGATSGTKLESGAKSYQVTNSQKLTNRWTSFLKDHRNSGDSPTEEKDRFAKKRVLFIDYAVPKPDQDAGSVTAINTMIMLREFGFQVTFTTVDPITSDFAYVKSLQKLGFEILSEPFTVSLSQHLREQGERYDLVLSCRPEPTAATLSLVRQYCTKAPVIYHTMDLHFLRKQREAELFQDWNTHKESQRLRELETWLSMKADITIVHNRVEKEKLVGLGVDDKRIHETPLLLKIPNHRKSFNERRGIVFVGGFNHTPNVDAIIYFCSEVMPLLKKLNPEIFLDIVGSNPTNEIKSLEDESINVIGHVDDIEEVFSKARLSVAPLRYGAGVKGKVGKSISAGTPVVGSQIALEGMLLVEGEGFQIADNSIHFAETITSLYSNEKQWEDISLSGHAAAEKLWGFKSGALHMEEILKLTGLNLRAPNHTTILF